MILPVRSFDLDLRDSPQPLAVQLDAAPLERLLTDAKHAHRIYELALLERPGDLWDYLEVVPLHLPPPLAARLDLARTMARNGGRSVAGTPLPVRDLRSRGPCRPGRGSRGLG